MARPVTTIVRGQLDGSNGLIRVFLELSRGLDQAGLAHTILCYEREPSAAECEPFTRLGTGVELLPGGASSPMRLLFELVRYCRREHPSLLMGHYSRAGLLAALAGWLTRTPVVRITHTPEPRPRGLLARLGESIKGRFLAALSARVVVVSETVARYEESRGTPSRKLRLIYHGIDPARVRPDASPESTRRALGLGEEDVALLMAAALVPVKNHGLMIEAIQSLGPSAPTLIIAGSGPQEETVRQRIREAGLAGKVLMIGQRTDVPDLMAACDAVVLPSFSEGLPQVLLEAMALAKPILASDIPANRELVEHANNGMLIDPTDVGAAAGALRDLAERPEEWRAMGRRGYRRVTEHFSLTQTRDRYLDLIGGLAR